MSIGCVFSTLCFIFIFSSNERSYLTLDWVSCCCGFLLLLLFSLALVVWNSWLTFRFLSRAKSNLERCSVRYCFVPITGKCADIIKEWDSCYVLNKCQKCIVRCIDLINQIQTHRHTHASCGRISNHPFKQDGSSFFPSSIILVSNPENYASKKQESSVWLWNAKTENH